MANIKFYIQHSFVNSEAELLNITAVDNNKVLKTIAFYENLETCLGVIKYSASKFNMNIARNIDFQGKKMEISKETVENIIKSANEQNVLNFKF